MRIRKQGPADPAINDEEILAAAKISDALAHPVRIRMLRYILTENLARHTVTNKDLVSVFDYAQATISQHLSKLLIGGLIDVRKKGTSSCYFAKVGRLSFFTDMLKKIESRGDEGEMPDFLRAELFEPEESAAETREEIIPEFLSGSMDSMDTLDSLDPSQEDFDDDTRYL
jgi:DNA-binding transcriptional ArsR family regulator